MERLTSNKPVEEMSMVELAHNSCYAKDGLARYRDFEMDMDARDFARNLMTTLTDDELPLDDDNFDEEILENLMYDPFSNVKGLIALFYRNLWAMADLREKLKYYEDAEEQGLLLRLPVAIGSTIYRFEYPTKIDDNGTEWSVLDKKRATIKPMKFALCHLDSIGKLYFLTKEEAEQALKQMGE